MVPNFQTLLIINSDLYLASPPARTKGRPAESCLGAVPYVNAPLEKVKSTIRPILLEFADHCRGLSDFTHKQAVTKVNT